jgi:hypothetical protein
MNDQQVGGLGQIQPQRTAPPALAQARNAPPKSDPLAETDITAANQMSENQPFDVGRELTNLNEGRMALDAQIKKMQESLSKRTQLPYDPRFMALGVGLAQPTKTGSFVESLGQGMGKFHEATMGEQERQQGLDTQNLDLMMKRQQLQQKLAGSGLIQTLAGSPQGALPMPSQSGAPTGIPLGGTAVPTGMPGGMPPMGASRPGLPTTVTGFNPIGRRELVAAQQIGDADTEKFLFNLQKAEVEAKKAADAGFTEVTIPYSDKKVRVRTEVSDEFFALGKEVAKTGDEQKLIRFMVANNMIAPVKRTNAKGEIEYERPQTEAEAAQEKERRTQTEKTRAELAEKSANELKNRAVVAFDNIQTGNDMISYVKGQPELFRFMNTGGLRDTIMTAIKNGVAGTVGGADLRVNLPLETLKRLYRSKTGQEMTNEQIDTLQMFAQSAAQLNIQFRKTMQGQGQITEKESELAKQLGAMLDDSDVVIRLKSELMIERSKFDDKSYGAWLEYRKTGKSYDEFLHSNDYKELKSEYSNTLQHIREANAQLLGKKTPTSTAPSTRPPAPSGSSIPEGYIRDPQTGVIRRKRGGE